MSLDHSRGLFTPLHSVLRKVTMSLGRYKSLSLVQKIEIIRVRAKQRDIFLNSLSTYLKKQS